MQHYHTVPDVPDNYPLDESHGFFSVIISEATTNLVTNPSVELATTGYTAVGGSVARSTTQQRRGVYSLAVTPTSAATDGVYYGTISLTSGTTYTASVDVYGAPGVEYQLNFATTGGATLGNPFRFTGTGRWQRVAVSYIETSSTTRRVYITKRTGTSTAVFYIDGLQVEAKAYDTTYCDGDQQGFVPGQLPPPYQWTGTAHASTSTRSAQTRAGGREYSLHELGLVVLSYTGLGMAGVSVLDDTYAQGDGGLYDDTVVPPRTFAIAGVIDGGAFPVVQRKRAALQNAFRPDRTTPRQPLLLRYQATDACGVARGAPLEVVCVYAGGLEGETTNRHQEKVAIRFTMYEPYIRAAGESGSALTVQTAFTASGIMQRSAAGVWAAMGSGLTGGDGQPRAILTVPSGLTYVGGDFTDAGGSGADYIAVWNGSAWASVGSATALNALVLRLALAADRTTLYVAGSFTNAGGVANADYLATWNGSAWAAVGTPANALIRALALAPNGDVYVGGDFTDAGGSGADYIAVWNGSAWASVGSATALNNSVSSLAFGPDGYLYVGGAFTNAGGVANADIIARWNGTAWSALGSGGTGGSVTDIVFGPDSSLYAVGQFTTMGGIAAAYAARWNGSGWSTLGSGPDTALTRAAMAPDGTLYVVGAEFVGGLDVGGFARWVGSSWVYVDAAFITAAGVVAAEIAPSGVVTQGLSTAAGTAVTAAAITTVTVAGTANTYPIVTFTGPGVIKTLSNYTTGAAIYFDLTLLAGEVAVLDLTPGNTKFSSTYRANALSAILSASNLATWHLVPGANIISLFIDGASGATAAVLRWRSSYWSTDDGTE